MNRSLENTLNGLIPTHTGPIPRELVDLTASLLAASRQRVGTLRPEEEPARAYLCAHIACERLRFQLDLPQVQPKPPLPKRQYQVLYTQFQKALPGAQPSSPTKRGTSTSASTNSPRKPVPRRAPAKPRAPSTTTSTTPTDPITVLICRLCNHPSLSHRHSKPGIIIKYMLSGARSIDLHPPITPIDTITALTSIAAIYILTTSKLSGKEITGAEYTSLRALLVNKVLEPVSEEWGCMKGWNEYVKTLPSGKGARHLNKSWGGRAPRTKRGLGSKATEVGVPVPVAVQEKDLDESLGELSGDVRVVEWLKTVPVSGDNTKGDDERDYINLAAALAAADEASAYEPWVDPDDDEEGQEEQVDDDALQRPPKRSRAGTGNQDNWTGAGIGKMLQDRVDYLSERRRKAYAEWKKEVMARVVEIEKARGKRAGVGEGSAKARAVVAVF
ncbi:origin recognition complex subunit 6-domain-containing protein [Kalaharituber pfeilii]|nr:origin recognition complex subunit 6-domain-containing protein [Kalaharituber pfeilii]